MTAKDIKKQLNNELNQILKPYGFKYDNKSFQFIKTTSNGHWAVAPGLTNFSPLFKLGFTFLVRLKEIEEIYKSYSRILPDYQQYSSTIMVSHDYFKEKRYFEYHFYNAEELSIAIKDFKNVFENQVFPFLERHSDIKSIFGLVGAGEIKKIDITASPDNYIHWLIIAKIGVHEDINGLAHNFLQDFWKNNEVEQDRKRVERLLEDLQNHKIQNNCC